MSKTILQSSPPRLRELQPNIVLGAPALPAPHSPGPVQLDISNKGSLSWQRERTRRKASAKKGGCFWVNTCVSAHTEAITAMDSSPEPAERAAKRQRTQNETIFRSVQPSQVQRSPGHGSSSPRSSQSSPAASATMRSPPNPAPLFPPPDFGFNIQPPRAQRSLEHDSSSPRPFQSSPAASATMLSPPAAAPLVSPPNLGYNVPYTTGHNGSAQMNNSSSPGAFQWRPAASAPILLPPTVGPLFAPPSFGCNIPYAMPRNGSAQVNGPAFPNMPPSASLLGYPYQPSPYQSHQQALAPRAFLGVPNQHSPYQTHQRILTPSAEQNNDPTWTDEQINEWATRRLEFFTPEQMDGIMNHLDELITAAEAPGQQGPQRAAPQAAGTQNPAQYTLPPQVPPFVNGPGPPGQVSPFVNDTGHAAIAIPNSPSPVRSNEPPSPTPLRERDLGDLDLPDLRSDLPWLLPFEMDNHRGRSEGLPTRPGSDQSSVIESPILRAARLQDNPQGMAQPQQPLQHVRPALQPIPEETVTTQQPIPNQQVSQQQSVPQHIAQQQTPRQPEETPFSDNLSGFSVPDSNLEFDDQWFEQWLNSSEL